MNVNVTTEEVFLRDISGVVWSPGGFGDCFWSRYLLAFDRVRIIARIRPVSVAPANAQPVTSPMIEFFPIRDFSGSDGFGANVLGVVSSLAFAGRLSGAFIARLPGVVGIGAGMARLITRRPYAVEVIGDMAGVAVSGAIGRGAFAWIAGRTGSFCVRVLCRNACAASYVTERALQERYPPHRDVRGEAIAGVDVMAPDHVPTPMFGRQLGRGGSWRIFAAGTMNVPYKGFDVLLDAIASHAELRQRARLRIAGSGRLRWELEKQAARLGLEASVTFLGQLSRADMDAEFDNCDLYVAPSLTEGLPKAIIEAMIRGAPVIATSVGGIPELIDARNLVPPRDFRKLAALMVERLSDSSELQAMQNRNLRSCGRFLREVLMEKRRMFYVQVLERTNHGLSQ
jgi:phosphatidylinositol alpha-1,6-mannosyltransferase